MRNKYAGTCYRCGQRVEPGKGHFERHEGGWRTQHADCAIKAREAREARAAQPDARARADAFAVLPTGSRP